MDVQNISNLESPLYNTLVTRSQRDPWTYSLLSNIGSFSKSRVEVPPQTDPGNFKDSDQEVHWKIPRYGLLAKVAILNRIEYTDADALTDQPDFQNSLGFYLWKEIKLETHNKRIQALYPEYQQMRMKSLPYERRESMQGAVAADGTVLTTEGGSTSATRQFYTPTFFSFSERTNNFIDTRFVENLEVVATARRGSEITTLGSNTSNTLKFSSGYPKLVCYFYNPTEEIYRAYQHRNFTLERPLTMLQYDVFKETPEVKKYKDINADTVNGKMRHGLLTFNKKLDCNNLVFATHLMVREKTKDNSGATSIQRGRELAKMKRIGVQFMDDGTHKSVMKFDGDCPFIEGTKVTVEAESTVDAENRQNIRMWEERSGEQVHTTVNLAGNTYENIDETTNSLIFPSAAYNKLYVGDYLLFRGGTSYVNTTLGLIDGYYYSVRAKLGSNKISFNKPDGTEHTFNAVADAVSTTSTFTRLAQPDWAAQTISAGFGTNVASGSNALGQSAAYFTGLASADAAETVERVQNFVVTDVNGPRCRLIQETTYNATDKTFHRRSVGLGDGGSDSDGSAALRYTVTAKTVKGQKIDTSGYRDHASFLQIENLKVSGTSRELIDQPGYELLHLDNASFNRLSSSEGTGVGKGLTESSGESIYSLYWGLDNSRVACSGALSLKNLAAPEIEVKVDIPTAQHADTEYELLIFHEFWQLVSVQGSDGRVSVGISV